MHKYIVFLASLLVASSSQAATTYTGNGQSGFGSVLGSGSLILSDDTSTISGTFNRGSGSFNDTMVIYIDSSSTGGNFTDANQLNSSGSDLGRRAIGAGTYSLAFPSGFAADYAIALGVNSGTYNFGGLWQLASNMDTAPFISTVNLSNLGNTSASSYSFSLSAADIGLSAGSTFSFVVAYLNPSNTFLSNESFVNTFSTGGSNPGFGGASFVGAANSYTISSVPEPSRALLAMLGLGAMIFRRRR